jgi:hypothetical protein
VAPNLNLLDPHLDAVGVAIDHITLRPSTIEMASVADQILANKLLGVFLLLLGRGGSEANSDGTVSERRRKWLKRCEGRSRGLFSMRMPPA